MSEAGKAAIKAGLEKARAAKLAAVDQPNNLMLPRLLSAKQLIPATAKSLLPVTGERRVATRPCFGLGRLVATPGVLQAFEASGDSPADYIRRHVTDDWGDVCAEDQAANEQALACGFWILSSYRLSNGTPIWLITEGDRSSTCLLLPGEY